MGGLHPLKESEPEGRSRQQEAAKLALCANLATPFATTLVEAPGIEPGSENASRETSTCVARKLISPAERLRTGSKQASLRKSPQER